MSGKLNDEKRQKIIAAGKEILNTNPSISSTRLIREAVDKAFPNDRISTKKSLASFSWFFDTLYRTGDRLDRLITDVRALTDLMLEVATKLDKPDKPKLEKVRLTKIAVVGLIGNQSGRILNAVEDVADVTCYDNVEQAFNKGFSNYDYVITTRHVRHTVTEKAAIEIGKENVIFLETTNIGIVISTIQNLVKR